MSDETIVIPPLSSSGSTATSGLETAGKMTEVTLSSVAWTALPATPLVDRNALSIQNVSGTEIKVNFDSGVGYVGVVVASGSERFYNISDSIVIYARAASGSPVVTVEELS